MKTNVYGCFTAESYVKFPISVFLGGGGFKRDAKYAKVEVNFYNTKIDHKRYQNQDHKYIFKIQVISLLEG